MVGARKFKLTIEPSETDIQAGVLNALGRQDRVLVERKGQKVWVLDGLYKRPGGVFWRYREGLPTIVTTGRNESEFRAKYGAALMRRLTRGTGFMDMWEETK